MPPVGFEPTFSAGERPKVYALDRAATGTGMQCTYNLKLYDMMNYKSYTCNFVLGFYAISKDWYSLATHKNDVIIRHS